MKKLIFLLIFCLLLTGCTGKSDTVILIATPSAAPTAALSATPSSSQSPSVEPSSSPSATPSAAAPEEASPAATPISAPSPTPSLTPSQEPSPTPAPTDAQPPLLQKSVTSLGRNLDSLRCEQLILVSASGSSCKVYTYERASDGIWTKVLGTSGYIGRNGVSSSKREGDKKTPLGIYPLGFAFGNDDNPNADYPWRSVTSESYWVDDPDSRFYNQWVEGTAEQDWNSAEKLWRIRTEYALAVVVEYNYGSSAVPGDGSAIFLHVGDSPTSGCIAIPKSDLKSIIRWLDDDQSPCIVIAEG